MHFVKLFLLVMYHIYSVSYKRRGYPSSFCFAIEIHSRQEGERREVEDEQHGGSAGAAGAAALLFASVYTAALCQQQWQRKLQTEISNSSPYIGGL